MKSRWSKAKDPDGEGGSFGNNVWTGRQKFPRVRCDVQCGGLIHVAVTTTKERYDAGSDQFVMLDHREAEILLNALRKAVPCAKHAKRMRDKRMRKRTTTHRHATRAKQYL